MAEGGDIDEGPNPGQLRVFNWSIMGENHKGWAETRKDVVRHNIHIRREEYDIIFLQEVQWGEGNIKTHFAPEGFEVVIKKYDRDKHCCIVYRSSKLQKCEDEAVNDHYMNENLPTDVANRMCVQTFTLKGGSSAFVAISLHAPKIYATAFFCSSVEAFIAKVVVDHGLPVLVGGNFNTDEHIKAWENDGFIGLRYAYECKPIDFITMKVPKDTNFLEMAEVEKMRFCDIVIPESLYEWSMQMVKTDEDHDYREVQKFRKEHAYNFFGYLCHHHTPLTVVLTCHSDKWLHYTVARLTHENVMLKQRVDNLERKMEQIQFRLEDRESEVLSEVSLEL